MTGSVWSLSQTWDTGVSLHLEFPQFLFLPNPPQASLQHKDLPMPMADSMLQRGISSPDHPTYTSCLFSKPDSRTPSTLAHLLSFGSRKNDWLSFFHRYTDGGGQTHRNTSDLPQNLFKLIHGSPSPLTPMRSRVNKRCSYSAICL